MKAMIGLLIFCAFIGFIAFMGTTIALYLLCKDLDIDDVTMEDEQ